MAGLYYIGLLALVLRFTLGYKDYIGYQVFHVKAASQYALNTLDTITDKYQLDVWKTASVHGRNVDVMISSDVVDDVISDLQSSGLEYSVMVEDAGRMMIESANYKMGPVESALNTSRFYNTSEIHNILEDQANICGADCQIYNIGESYEGRQLKLIKIGRPGSARRSIWLDGGIHAREWLTPAVNIYFVDKLINDYGIDPEVTLMRDSFDWYIHPVVNPDGYDYTWTTDRMWRKTRSLNADECVGTDPNRNYGYMWGGGDNNTCSEIYQGSSAESESEISSFTAFVMNISNSLDLVISYHTYGEIMVMPWAYSTQEPSDIADLERLAAIGVDAINANSTLVYEYGQITGTEPGISMDWAKGTAGVKYSYVVEMRGGGTYGFLAPPSEILPTGQENWAGVVAMATDIMQNRL